jgi:hypothetical protein
MSILQDETLSPSATASPLLLLTGIPIGTKAAGGGEEGHQSMSWIDGRSVRQYISGEQARQLLYALEDSTPLHFEIARYAHDITLLMHMLTMNLNCN